MSNQNSLPRDQNRIVVAGGLYDDGSGTIAGLPINHLNGRLKVTIVGGGGGSTFVNNEIVAGSGFSWTLAQTPLVGTEHIYANGQRLTPGVENDYVISGTVITTVNSYGGGTVLSDYQTS